MTLENRQFEKSQNSDLFEGDIWVTPPPPVRETLRSAILQTGVLTRKPCTSLVQDGSFSAVGTKKKGEGLEGFGSKIYEKTWPSTE